MSALEDIQDILRGALASLGGFGGRVIARLILMLLAGQLYGAEALGILGQVAALTEILAATAVIGLKRSLLDILSQPDNEDKTSKIIKEALISSLLLASFMSIVFGVLWGYLFTDIELPILLLAAIPAIVFAEVAGTAIRFQRIIRWEVIARCIFEPWAFLASATLFYWLSPSETGLLSAYAISALAAAFGIGIGLSKAYSFSAIFHTQIEIRSLYQIPLKSLPVGITDIGIMMFRRIDILLLSLVAGHGVTGIYYMAQQIVTVPHKIHQLFEPMMAPVLAKLHHGAKRKATGRKLSGFCRWVLTLQLALTVPFILFSSELMAVFGEQFYVGGLVLSLLLIAELFDGSFALGETALVYAAPRTPPKLILIALMIETTAIISFSYFWGAEGAAFGFMIAMVSLAGMRLWKLKSKLDITILSSNFLKPLTGAFFIAAIFGFMKQETAIYNPDYFGIYIFAAVALYLGVIRLTSLTAEDKTIWKRLRAG
ncbi:lipopolysaccharide biosynthesis protein [Kordiimonas laminariae]|uniref:lipopolysaccharide biosynthesis protein n=1 Tax=Kordiimonas laminariae TaxID=2917717 RepID=UPI001FF3679C|nr:polysaccharide biosynthesis C-terminal domain-containing protein [Kordiimonas laminariae]MCK0070840.1 hypothetical protein [Kordiimonas laminariae]